MQDVLDIINNVQSIYNSNTSFQVLKDFERVLDELDIYVYANWQEGELAFGPKISRHWVECMFIWDIDMMPDPMGGKRLVDYDCKVKYKKDFMVVPRKIEEPGDMRPGTKKGKLDKKAIWVVSIQMPKSLIADIFGGYQNQEMDHLSLDQQEQEQGSPPQSEDDVSNAEDGAGTEEPIL